MVYAVGAEKEKTYEKALLGHYMKAAVECWFTSSGRAIPLKLKYEDHEGIIQTIDKIQLVYSEQKYFGGILMNRYCCNALVDGKLQHFILLFNPETGLWNIVMKNE